MLRRPRTAIPVLLLALITIYGALLRFDVFVQRYGTLDHPLWARVLTQDLVPLVSQLHPARFRWYHVDQPYLGGDPINYLKFGREMRSFYQAHVREPLFVALTRVFLWLLSGQDAAVSFASATGSILTIVAAYLLGSALLSRRAGLVLSLLVAIEYDLISWSVDGWRDDLFMATVTLSAWTLVRCWRDPSLRNGALAGIATGLACLTRITALTFVLPSFAWLILDSPPETRRQRAKIAGAAAAVCSLIVAPYLVSCAVQFGDPFYAINYHTGYYRYGEGLPSQKPMSAAAYISSKIQGRPIAALDTGTTGLFVHPFTTKWNGLDGWIPRLASLLSSLSILGLIQWVFVPEGRLMLVILIGSLVPYALTWNVAGGGEWRFTMHVYPLYLLAAISAAAFAWKTATTLSRRSWHVGRIRRAVMIGWVAAAVGVAGVVVAYRELPWFVVREAIATNTAISVETGSRDSVFFSDGWSPPFADGPTFRLSTAERSVIQIPLPARRSYQVVLRLDPVAPDRQRRAVVLMNRQLLATLLLTWNPERVGAYPLLLPADKVRAGMNELTIVPDTLVTAGSAGSRFSWRDPKDLLGVRFWYLRVLASPDSPMSGASPGSRQAVESEAEFQKPDRLQTAGVLEPFPSIRIEVQGTNHHHVDLRLIDELE